MLNFLGIGGPRFTCELRCYPVTAAGRPDLESGNRLLLPPSALERLNQLGVHSTSTSPMLFEIADLEGRRRTHGGVLEFVAPEECCYMPQWILKQLRADEGDTLRVALKDLQKATSVRLRPASVALLRVYNPRALLENGLRNYVALTDGDSFFVDYNGKPYGLDVLEVHPHGAACIVEADVKVDFATPKDAELVTPTQSRNQDQGMQVGGSSSSADRGDSSQQASVEASVDDNKDYNRLFGGVGRRIDGVLAPKVLEEPEEEDQMPWKRKLPGGVKWALPPFGFKQSVETCIVRGPDGDQRRIGDEAESPLPEGVPLGGDSSMNAGATDRLKVRALSAAADREAENADEISERRRIVEEETRRREALEAEEEARKQAAAEEAKRRRAQVATAAPKQVEMHAAPKGGRAAKPGSSKGGCCGCCFRGSTANDSTNKV